VVGTCGSRTLENKKTFIQVDITSPGSTVSAETAAALAAASIVFKDTDPQYSNLCLKHAKELFNFADKTRSDAGYTAQQTFTHPTADSMTNLHGRLHGFILQQGTQAILTKPNPMLNFGVPNLRQI